MKFYFDMRDEDKKPAGETYWTEESIRLIKLYPATPKLDNEWMNNPDSWLWCVYEATDFSTNPMECKDKDHAYRELCYSLNKNIYERINDL